MRYNLHELEIMARLNESVGKRITYNDLVKMANVHGDDSFFMPLDEFAEYFPKVPDIIDNICGDCDFDDDIMVSIDLMGGRPGTSFISFYYDGDRDGSLEISFKEAPDGSLTIGDYGRNDY